MPLPSRRLAVKAALVAASLLAGCSTHSVPPSRTVALPRSGPGCIIDRVVDGDTIGIACPDGSGGTARLVGFDTPETYRPACPAERRLGLQATAYLTQRLDGAAQISVAPGGGRDKYGRMLLQLYVDGRDIGQDMMAQGLAVAYDGGKRINWCERLTA